MWPHEQGAPSLQHVRTFCSPPVNTQMRHTQRSSPPVHAGACHAEAAAAAGRAPRFGGGGASSRPASRVPKQLSLAAFGTAAFAAAGQLQRQAGRRRSRSWRHHFGSLALTGPRWHKRQDSAKLPLAAEGSSPVAEDRYSSSLAQLLLFLVYFVLQSGLTFYMKFVLAKVSVTASLMGVPASFLVTTTQQLVGFALVGAYILGSRFTGSRYTPKPLQSKKEYFLLGLQSLSFSLNIGLNLLSLALIPLSLSLIIRACTPLTTALTQTVLQKGKTNISAGEWLCMVVGVVCACVAVIAQSGGPSGSSGPLFYIGVATAVMSIFCGSLDMVFKSILGTSMKLTPLDNIYHQALPVALITGIIGAAAPKPVSSSWAAAFSARMTDLEVFRQLWILNPSVLGWIGLSGVMAFGYNFFTTFLIVKLTPATTSFAGNFNKAANIMLSLLFFDGRLPPGVRGLVLLTAVAGNIGSFTLYNALKKKAKKKQSAA